MPASTLPAPKESSPQTAEGKSASKPTFGPLPATRIPEGPAGKTPPEPALPAAPALASGPEPRPKRAYRRRKPFQLTEARRAAARANLAKAREALRARGYPHSDLQRASARANLDKAHAAIRERGLPTTPRRRESSLANLARANAALRQRGYRRSDRQREAARRNLREAWKVSHDPENYLRTYISRMDPDRFAWLLEELFLGLSAEQLLPDEWGLP